MARQSPGERSPDMPYASSDLSVKIAWHYHVEGLTQQQIAERLGLSRVKVMRVLADAAAANLIVTRINATTAGLIALERRLEQRYGLSSAIVIPAPSERGNMERAIGHAVAGYLDRSFEDGMTLAIGGGATLHASLDFLTRRSLPNAAVVGLVGSLPHSRWINPSIVAAKVGETLGAVSYQINAPVVVDSPDLCGRLWAQAPLADVKARARKADLAVLTVGGMSADATIFKHGIVSADLLEPLRGAGAVANMLCHFLDAKGRLVAHEINERIMAVPLEQLASIPQIAVAGGGRHMAEALRAALAAVSPTVLIVDVDAAEALSEDRDP